MSQAPRYMKEIPARFCMFLASRQFVLDPFKEIHMRFIALWIFCFFLAWCFQVHITSKDIYIYIHTCYYIYRYIYIFKASVNPPRPSKFLLLFPTFPRFLAPPWFLRSRQPVLPAWCLVRFPLVATLPRPGPISTPKKWCNKIETSLQCLTWGIFQSTFLFVKKLDTFFQSTIFQYLYIRSSGSVDDVHEFLDLVHHG